jgi:hypothetical protein
MTRTGITNQPPTVEDDRLFGIQPVDPAFKDIPMMQASFDAYDQAQAQAAADEVECWECVSEAMEEAQVVMDEREQAYTNAMTPPVARSDDPSNPLLTPPDLAIPVPEDTPCP